MLWRRSKQCWYFGPKERMRSEDHILLHTIWNGFVQMMVGDQFFMLRIKQARGNSIQIKSVRFHGWKRQKNSLIFPSYTDQSPWVSTPGILQKDTRELCLYSPAKSLEAAFAVVPLWCYKSGITSAAWEQSRTHEPFILDYKMLWEGLTTYTV